MDKIFVRCFCKQLNFIARQNKNFHKVFYSKSIVSNCDWNNFLKQKADEIYNYLEELFLNENQSFYLNCRYVLSCLRFSLKISSLLSHFFVVKD